MTKIRNPKPLTPSLSPERLCRNYYFVTLNLFQGLVTI
jgi:hypothetical protein